MPGSNTYCRSSPVLVPAQPEWANDYAGVTVNQLAGLSDEQLATADPLAVNLIVAREIPSLADLDLAYYQERVNAWALDFATRYLPEAESSFHEQPERYFDDLGFFCVGMLCQYLGDEVGIKYIEEQRTADPRHYIDPSDLFLNGLIDTLRGTCGNMPALALAIGWRMGWQVSVACAGSHSFLRYDDGNATFNMEVATSLEQGFWARSDEDIIAEKRLPPEAVACGSDMKALSPRERLGVFIGLRARHFKNLGEMERNREWLRLAERDYLLARWLFPAHREHNKMLLHYSAYFSDERFDRREAGHWRSYGQLMVEVDEYLQGSHPSLQLDHRWRLAPEAIDRVLQESDSMILVQGL